MTHNEIYKQLDHRWNKAIDLLIDVVFDITRYIKFEIEDTTTDNYNEFIEEINKDGYFTISRDGTLSSIYENQAVNIKARVWHDYHHYHSKLSFSYEDELKVLALQLKDIDNYCSTKTIDTQTKEDAKSILSIDIQQQVEYYQTHKCFVNEQRSFVRSIWFNDIYKCYRGQVYRKRHR